jgi:hypothetical protein
VGAVTARPATLLDLRKFVQAGVRRVGKGFTHADDDWTAMLFVQSPKGVEIQALPPHLFAGQEAKDLLAAYLKGYVADRGAYRYALLLNGHMKAMPSEEELQRHTADELHIRDMAGATELLLLSVGDAETEELWTSDIGRTPRGLRTPGPWHRIDSHTGRFAGLNAALRRERSDQA